MYKPETSPYLIEVQARDGTWKVAGSSKTEELAHKAGLRAQKAVKGLAYRVVKRK